MFLLMIAIVLFWNIQIIWSSANTPEQINQLSEICEKLEGKELLAIPGLPLEIEYSSLMKTHMYLRSLYLKEGSNITCSVADAISNQVMNSSVFPRIEDYLFDNPMNLAYKIPKVNRNTSLQYRINCGYARNSTTHKVNKPRCISYNLNVTILNGTAGDDGCDGSAIKTRNDSMKKGKDYRLSCFAEATEHLQYFPNLTFRWFRDRDGKCATNFADDVTVDESTHQLIFKKSDFHDAGVYTCTAHYNDKLIVLVRQNVCVKYRYISNADMELKCNAIKVPANGNGTVTCDVSISIEKSLWGRFFWYKIQPNGDAIEVCNNSYSIDGDRVSCFEKSTIDRNRCYYSVPTEEPSADVRTITLNIQNMKADDFGKYRLQYRVIGIMKGRISSYTSIEMDSKKQISTRIAGIALGVLTLILIIGIIMLGLVTKMDILWFYKRHFGSFERGTYPYMAYFVYRYHKGEQNSESNKKTNALVQSMHDFVRKLGGTAFDEQRDIPLEPCDGNNVMAVQSECHRIVLFLSADFVTDHWSRFATYTAIEGMIREGNKIILITTPETESAMKNIEDEARKVLEMAMKRNTTIHWNGKVPLSGAFRRRLEYALPKFHRSKPGFNRYLSESSQAQLTEFGSPVKSLCDLKKKELQNDFESITRV